MAGLPERIRTAAERLGSNRRLAELAGMPETTLYRYMSGEHVPNAEALVRVANAAGVNLQWLATGNGSMLRGAQEVLLKNEQELKDFYLIPRYKVSASAGAGALIESEQIVDALAFKIDWLRRNLSVQARNLVLISAVGDSMAPTIKSGDLLLVNTAETRFRDDAVYVLAIEDSLIQSVPD